MNKKPKSFWITCAIWTVTLISFLFLLIFISCADDVEVYNTRQYTPARVLTDYRETDVEDPGYPSGGYRELTFVLDNIEGNSCSLCFYLENDGVRVFFDDDLVYSLIASPDNRAARSPGNHWVCIPVSSADVGTEVQIQLIPTYSLKLVQDVELIVGNRFSVFVWQMMNDLPSIILAFLCLVLGAIIIISRIYFRRKQQAWRYDLLYLGLFSILIGLWRLGDLRITSWIFSDHPMLLSYLTQSLLIMSLIPLMFFLCSMFPARDFRGLHYTSLGFSILIACAPAFQLLGVFELRQTLPMFFVILATCLSEVVIVYLFRNYRYRISKGSWAMIIVLVLGSVADVLSVVSGYNTHGVLFQLISFLIFGIYMYGYCVSEAGNKAYVDAMTGLLNKTRWEQHLEKSAQIREPVAIVMIDLNGLKHVNDSSGHDTGDKLILFFSNILRKAVMSTDYVCRWGGDEFAILIRNADQENVDTCLAEIRKKVDAYNLLGLPPTIEYAAGYALSSEHPECSRSELFRLADEMMYTDKKAWYKARGEEPR